MTGHTLELPSAGAPTELDALSEREVEVFGELARGRSNAEIASTLFLSEATVKTHVARILAKLDLRDRVQAVVLAYETGVVNTADPLGGSYFVEKLTLETEEAADRYIRHIDGMGGMIAAIEAGYPQSEIAAASYRYQREVEAGSRVIVGVNRFQSDDQPIELLQIDESAALHQEAKLAALRVFSFTRAGVGS